MEDENAEISTHSYVRIAEGAMLYSTKGTMEIVSEIVGPSEGRDGYMIIKLLTDKTQDAVLYTIPCDDVIDRPDQYRPRVVDMRRLFVNVEVAWDHGLLTNGFKMGDPVEWAPCSIGGYSTDFNIRKVGDSSVRCCADPKKFGEFLTNRVLMPERRQRVRGPEDGIGAEILNRVDLISCEVLIGSLEEAFKQYDSYRDKSSSAKRSWASGILHSCTEIFDHDGRYFGDDGSEQIDPSDGVMVIVRNVLKWRASSKGADFYNSQSLIKDLEGYISSIGKSNDRHEKRNLEVLNQCLLVLEYIRDAKSIVEKSGKKSVV